MTFTKLAKLVWLFLYYLIARYLPASTGSYGLWARAVRRYICRHLFKYAGMNINIEKGAFFGDGSQIEIGDNSGIGVDCCIYGPVKIGHDVMMGPEVLIFTVNHRFNRLDIPMCQQGRCAPKPVIIEDDVWIAARVIILPGVRVSRGAVLGANAIITKDVPEYAIVGGNPAAIIRYRTDDSQKPSQ